MARKNLLAVAVVMGLAQGAYAQETPTEEPQSTEAAASSQDATTLDAVQVQGKFVAQGAKSAMKQDITVMETPFSVAAYSDSFMKSIETTSVADLYSYMTGVRRGGNTGYDISIRGFKSTQADKNAIMVDGMPGVAGRFGSPPTFAAEGVEVVKGPASILYGGAQPGGFVNIITKKPKAKSAALIDLRGSTYSGAGLSAGDANGYNLGVDFTGPIDSEQRFLYRLVAEYADKDGFRYNSWDESQYIAPSLTWHATDATQITAAFEYRKRENSYENNQLVAPNKDANRIADIRTRYQEKGDTADEKAYSGTVTVSHYFQNGSTLNLAARSVRGEDYAQGFDNVGVLADGVTLRRRARQQFNQRDYDYFDGNFSIPFATGPVEHKFLVGATYGVDTTDFERIQFFDGPASGAASLPGPGRINVSVYNPILGQTPPLSSFPTGPVNRRYTENTSLGVYVSDLMTLSERWKVSLGLRYADEKQDAEERKTPPLTRNSTSSSTVLPSAGLLFHPKPNWTLYASYATSYVPQAAGVQDAAGNPNPFDPQEGRQYEIGAKTELLDNRLTATLAFFDIEKSNTVAPIACNAGVGGTCSQQVGAERSKGTEFELNYQVSENLQLIGGIAYTDAYVSETYAAGAAPLVGARLTNSALKSANLWTRYDFSEGPLRNLGIGAGLSYSSEIAGSLPSANDQRILILPSYTVADLAFYYRVADRYDFTLKIGNVFDKLYFEGVNSTTNENGVVPGVPRNITLSVRIPLW
ncbi:TonB-dependent siderophore receptor [uncultured Pseudoxanthomonas sp.]|nr:TonB-dependent siderophore receptor [uncultured Pseudoxanthomonas sp.]